MVLPFEAILQGGSGRIPIEQDHIKFFGRLCALLSRAQGFSDLGTPGDTRGVSVGRSAALSARTGNSLLRASPHRRGSESGHGSHR